MNKVLSHNSCLILKLIFGLRTILVHDLNFGPLHDLSLGSIPPTIRPVWHTIPLIHDLVGMLCCPCLPVKSFFKFEHCPLIRRFHRAFPVHHVSTTSYDYHDWCPVPCFQHHELVKDTVKISYLRALITVCDLKIQECCAAQTHNSHQATMVWPKLMLR